MDLPLDIWHHIISFVPTEQLQALYGVDHTFFNLAMNIRYKEVTLYQDDEPETVSRTLSHLQPHVHRIRTLNLRPDVAAYNLPPVMRPKREPKLRNGILKFLHRFQAKDSSPALGPTAPPPTLPTREAVKYAKHASDLIARMSHVEELKMEGLWVGDGPAGLRSICCAKRNLIDLEYTMQTMIATGWSTFGSTLRRLKLRLLHYCFLVSTMPTLVFPCLEELHITLDLSIFLRDRVVPFINDHHSTLQSLELSFEEITSDACSYLDQIRKIPNLTIFRFRYHVVNPMELNTSGLRTFLSTHASNLRILRLDLYTDEDRRGGLNRHDWSAQPVFNISLPRLESLELGWGCFTSLEKIGTYLGQYTHSLTALKFERRRLSFQEVKVLLEALAGCHKLRSLSMHVLHLTVELLDLLAMKLPLLGHLYMMFQFFLPSQNETAVEDIDAKQFCLAMGERSYPEWKIRHFVGRSMGSITWSTITKSNCEAALRIAIPSLDTLMFDNSPIDGTLTPDMAEHFFTMGGIDR